MNFKLSLDYLQHLTQGKCDQTAVVLCCLDSNDKRKQCSVQHIFNSILDLRVFESADAEP
jgi:D-Tyr-tRNAtyr deacylase